MKAQILNGEINTRTLPARDGKPALIFRTQKAAIVRDNDFPLPFSISLQDDQAGYPPGEYEVAASSLEADKFDGIKFARRIVLVPVKK
jgi:hypothetical protein